MKNYILYFSLLFLGLLALACKKETLAFKNNYDKSYQAWLAFKASSNNSYHYTVAVGSWSGTGWETKITVSAGKVVARDFKYTRPDSLVAKLPAEVRAWQENENEINTHSNSGAANPYTLDEIYALAINDWLLIKKDRKNIFEANNNGIISSCGYIPDNCADDCFVGTNLRDIAAN